jgi:RNA-binding protein Musashi
MSDCSKVEEVLRAQPHYVDGKQVECKIAIPKDYIGTLGNDVNLTNEQQSSGLYNSRKIFVGGLHPALKEVEMRAYFEQFGEVEQCVIMHDKPTGKSRGFGFVIFVRETSADQVMYYKNKHNIMGKWVDCKRAMPKEIISKENGSFAGNGSGYKDKNFKEFEENFGYDQSQNNSFGPNANMSSGHFSLNNSSCVNSNLGHPINQNYVVNNYCK